MFAHTALQCFAALARHHGVDLSVERLAHDYALTAAEPDTEKLMRIAQDKGFRARSAMLSWEELTRLPARDFPLLLRLKSGNMVAAATYRADTEQVIVVDPLAPQQGQIPYGRNALEQGWSGEAILLRRVYRITDENQPFGLAWFVPEMVRQRRLFRDVVIAAFSVHGLALALPIFFQLIIDKVLVHHSFSTLYVLSLGIVVAIIFEAVFGFLRQYMMLYASSKMDLRLAMRVFAHLTSLPITFFERNLAGVLVQHMQQNRRIREFLTGRLFMTLVEASALLVFLPVLFLYSWKLAAILLAYCAAIGGVIALLIKPFRRRLLELYQAEAQRQGLLVETIHGMPTVKSLALEPRRRRSWEERSAAAANMQFRVGKISAIAHASTGLLEKLMLVTVIAVGATDVFTGAMSVGALVAFQMLSSRVSGPLVQIVSLIHEYQEVLLSVRMLGEVMNQRAEGASLRGITPEIRGDIEFENVGFSYVPESRAVDRVTFRIPPGNVVGIVGRSGSGKTTLARLIQGLYAPQEGIIRFDGVNSRDIDLFHLRRNIGVVLQETFLLHGTVRENISVTRTDATLEEILEAARLAGATEFIERLPQGLDTMLVENGANLSGGQKQRLAIARALLPQPRILIFDEATSALDPESEAIIQQNLAAIAHGRTLVVISHRLSSLVNADMILVMDQGAIVDYGKHAALAERAGIYQDLWRQQARFMR